MSCGELLLMLAATKTVALALSGTTMKLPSVFTRFLHLKRFNLRKGKEMLQIKRLKNVFICIIYIPHAHKDCSNELLA